MTRVFCILLIVLAQMSCQENTRGKTNSNSFDKEKEEQQQQGKKLIHIQTEGCSSCKSCVSLSASIETNENKRALLSMYLYNSLVGGYDCPELENSKEELFKIPSFSSTVLIFFNNNEYHESVEVKGNNRLVSENRDELVYRIENTEVLHEVANELLEHNNTIGLKALWSNGELSKLDNYQDYLSRMDRSNFFVLANQVAFLHNIKEFELRDQLMNDALEIDGFEDQQKALRQLLEKDQFDLSTYMEEVYGGF